MNVHCPKCEALYRIDPARVPAAGARVRCARCADVFLLTRNGASAHSSGLGAPAAAGPGAPGRPAPAPRLAQAPSPPPPPTARPAPAAPVGAPPPRVAAGPAMAPPRPAAAPPRPAPAPIPAAGPTAAPPPRPQAPPPPAAPSAAAPRRSFAAQDPNARAQRIARALVSDIVAYNPDRREKSLAAGTLRTEFREEIMKSWEEYVAQVGAELAKSTPHFRMALNDILAKGAAVF